jgi:hypothetical protein
MYTSVMQRELRQPPTISCSHCCSHHAGCFSSPALQVCHPPAVHDAVCCAWHAGLAPHQQHVPALHIAHGAVHAGRPLQPRHRGNIPGGAGTGRLLLQRGIGRLLFRRGTRRLLLRCSTRRLLLWQMSLA